MATETCFGTWWNPNTPDDKIPGQIEWEQPRQPVVSLLPSPRDFPISLTNRDDELGLPLHPNKTIPMMHGDLARLGGVTALSGRSGGFELAANITDKIQFTFAIIGIYLSKPDEKFIRRVEINMPSIAPLLGLRPIRTSQEPTQNTDALTLSLDSRRCKWNVDDIEVEWLYRDIRTQSDTSMNISMSPIVILTSSRQRSLEYWIDQWVLPIFQFATFACGAHSRMRSIRLWAKKHITPSEWHGSALPLWMAGVGESEIPTRRPTISTRDIESNPDGLPGVIDRYRTFASRQDVFLEQLWQVIRIEDRPISNRYLDLMSGLESYHSRAYGEAPISHEEYKQKQKEVYSILNDKLDDDPRGFIKKWMPSRPFYSLPTRLRTIGDEVGMQGWKIGPDALTKIRNDIAHGNPTNRREMREAYDQILLLARQLTMKNLGINIWQRQFVRSQAAR